MKYRKKPVVIEAFQYKKGMKHKVLKPIYDHMNGSQPIGLGIKTLEGCMLVNEGDWIIKGIKGEYYSCKPDIFKKTYELASIKNKDSIFINHIKSQLSKNQKVICKICGKSAEEIIKESL